MMKLNQGEYVCLRASMFKNGVKTHLIVGVGTKKHCFSVGKKDNVEEVHILYGFPVYSTTVILKTTAFLDIYKLTEHRRWLRVGDEIKTA